MTRTNPPGIGEVPPLRSIPHCWILLALGSLPFLLAGPAAADVVVKKDGMEVRGRVADLGGNAVEIRVRSGAGRRIHLREIRSATFEAVEAEPLQDRDVVFRKNGSEIAGDVRFSEDGRSIVVSQPDGSQVQIPRDEVARIVTRDQLISEGGAVYTVKVRDEIRGAIATIAAGAGSLAEAEERLKTYGIFAIAPVREALGKAKAGSASALALARVARLYKLKEFTDDALQEIPDYYQVLSSGSPDEKEKLLVVMFTRYVTESTPVAKFLVLDPAEDFRIRSFAVALLGQNGRNRELAEIYSDPAGGQVQLAAAIALAKNRLLVGAEALIQGLELERPEVREVTFRALKSASGKDFGYGVHDTPMARKEAVAKWRQWWEENREVLKTQAANYIAGTGRLQETPERKRAKGLWREGCAALDDRRLPVAEAKLRAALKADPTYYKAQTTLGTFLAFHRRNPEEGVSLLDDIVRRRPEEIDPAELTWIQYDLGRVLEAAGNLERAELAFREALEGDPKFFRAALAIGALKFRLAVAGSAPPPGGRRPMLSDAESRYRTAIGLIDTYSQGIEVLALEDLAPETPPAFERQEHNQGVVALKAGLRIDKADAYFNIAKIRSLLDDRPRALESLGAGIETLGEDREGGARELIVGMRNHRALILEAMDRPEEAFEDYRAVVRSDLDPRNATALEGIRRLETRVGPAPAAEPRKGRPKRTPSSRLPAKTPEEEPLRSKTRL